MKMESACSVCLKQASSFDYEIIDEITRELLEVLLIDIKTRFGCDPLICSGCKNEILKCFEFKGKCIYTEDLMYPYIDAQNNAKVDIGNVYLKATGLNKIPANSENLNICRLCVKRVDGCFYNISEDTLRKYEVDEMFFQKFLPEVNLSATEVPIMCEDCLTSLKGFARFASCLPRVKEVLKSKSKNRGAVILSSQNVKQKQVHTNETVNEKYQCEKCSYESSSISNIRRHFQSIHVENNPEYLISSIEKYRCEECQMNFKKLDNHYRRFHQMYTCKVCNRSFESLASLRRHMKRDKNLKTIFHCAKCKYTTTDKRILKTHVRIHMEHKHCCDKCPFTAVHKSSLVRHSLLHSKLEKCEYRCDRCPFVTCNHPNLKKHMLVYHNLSENNLTPIIYTCNECEYSTTNKKYLRHHEVVHLNTGEIGEYKFPCNKCIYATNRKSDLTRHCSVMHSATPRKTPSSNIYYCADCSFTTKDKRCLRDHVMKHSNNIKYEYSCDKCAFGSNFHWRLVQHMLVHLSKTDKKLMEYRCNKCDFTTSHKASLRNHFQRHSENRKYRFHCDKCKYTSNRKINFEIHTKTHLENREKNYRCDKCTFATCYEQCLKRHSVLHSDVKIYHRCDKCTFTSIHKANLLKHMLTHNKNPLKGKKPKRKKFNEH